MEFEFEDRDLEELYLTGSGPRARRLPAELVPQFFAVMGFIRRAKDERDLRALKGRHFEKLKGDRRGTYSMRLHRQFRLLFRIESEVMWIESIEDYHR
ncbi:MAG: type II toxin-antitoxin system RelE/ParE family toxin [Fimbriimonas ginsengisoli]|uniref:Type II toxin-antitoxin system RelE/ParE family toxin n=1 Tax=Fimbriimonas ginsengisoli TaxID=1005039 RepID=A0A931LT34_FIMGI|nr:type II toxin-antitoxin system RelE/ParE family toxin [Fimbriimonas ginsengisoli]